MKTQISCGVLQGSLFEPTLWNLFYDQIIRIPTENGVKIIAYADDLVLVVTAANKESLEDKTSYGVEKIAKKPKEMGK